MVISKFITEGRTLLIIAVSILSAFITNLNSQSTEMPDPSVSGTQYFLAPEGNDANPGTKKQPWKTLEKANQALKPGDIVSLGDGTYRWIISPVNSG